MEIPELRVVFSVREEYIAELEPYASVLPRNPRARLRLERLIESTAKQAISGPVGNVGFKFDENLLNRLVKQLLHISPNVEGQFVEPVQLQVVCQSIWQNFARAKGLESFEGNLTKEELDTRFPDLPRVITETDVNAAQSVDDALCEYYENVIKVATDTRNLTNEGRETTKEGQLREWIDKVLITAEGRRGAAFEATLGVYSVSEFSLGVIIDKYLVRLEQRGEAKWYELTHDRFIEPVKKANLKWRKDHIANIEFAEYLNSKPADAILRREELKRAKRLKDDPTYPFEFPPKVDDQIRHTERRARRNRWLFLAFSCVAIGLFFLVWLAWELEGAALREQLAFNSERVLQKDPELAAMLAYAACEEPYLFPVFNERSQRESENAIITSLFNSRIERLDQCEISSGVAFSTNREWLARKAKAGGPDTYVAQVLWSDSLRVRGRDIAVLRKTKILAVSNDGYRIVLADDDSPKVAIKSVRLSIPDEEIVLPDNGRAEQASFSGDDMLAIGVRSEAERSTQRVLLWDLKHYDQVGIQILPTSDSRYKDTPFFTSSGSTSLKEITHIEFDNKRRNLVVACGWDGAALISEGGELKCWCKEQVDAGDRTSYVVWASINSSGDSIVTTTADGRADVWQIPDSGATTAAYFQVASPSIRHWGHRQPACMASFCDKDDEILIASNDGVAEIWDLKSNQISRTFLGPTEGVLRSVFAHDSDLRIVCLVGRDGTIEEWDASPDFPPLWKNSFEKPLRCAGQIRYATINADGTEFLTSRYDSGYSAWPGSPVGEGRIPNSPLLATPSNGHGAPAITAEAAHAPNKLTKVTLDHNKRAVTVEDLAIPDVNSLAFGTPASGDYAYIAQTQAGGQVSIYAKNERATLQPPSRSETGRNVRPTALGLLAADAPRLGKAELAVGYDDGAVFLFAYSPDFRRWSSEQILESKTDVRGVRSVTAIACSPLGKNIAVGLNDGTVVLVDANISPNGRRETVTREGSKGEIALLKFSPDGKRLVSGGSNGDICIWSLDNTTRDLKAEQRRTVFFRARSLQPHLTQLEI